MIIVVMAVTVLSLIIGGVMFSVTSSYRTITHAANWQEALLTAETGADFAMATLRKTITDPANAWNGWQTTDADGQPFPNNARKYQLASLNASGGAGGSVAYIEVDTPVSLSDSATGQQWYRIRSAGTTPLAGRSGVGGDKRDGALRKLSLVWDRKTGSRVSVPQASRLIEVIARPSSFENAITSNGLVQMNNHQIVADSFDSRTSAKSTNGQYAAAKRQSNADVATNGQIIDAGNSYIYGDVLTNEGTVTGAANISGEQRTDFYQELLPVSQPSWTVINSSSSSVTGNTTLQAGSASVPTRYKLDSINLTGNSVLSLVPSSQASPGYVEIWVTGDLKTSGGGTIKIEPGVAAKIYVAGQIDITGNGFVNNAARAKNLQVYGIASAPSTSKEIKISGNGAFLGTIYAPDHDIRIGGSGSSGIFCGAIVAKSVSMNGNAEFHYDEALAVGDLITDFKVASWFEDNQ